MRARSRGRLGVPTQVDVRLIPVIGAIVLVFMQHGALRWNRYTVSPSTGEVARSAGTGWIPASTATMSVQIRAAQEHCDFSVSTVVP